MNKMKYITSINPKTKKIIGKTKAANPTDIKKAINIAKKGFPVWKSLGIDKRMKILNKLTRLLASNKSSLAKLITQEMGKPIEEAKGEIDFAINTINDQIKIAKEVLKPRIITKNKYVLHEPIGVIGAITPWNFPILVPTEAFISALLAGNCVIFKPSEVTTLCSIAFTKLIWKAGVPKNVFQVLPGADEVGKALVKNKVNGIVFVGSRDVGKSIMRNSADNLHRIVLELGGKDPMVVCADADLKKAAVSAVSGGFRNTGQVCCSVERVYVVKKIAKAFINEVVELAKKVTVGENTNTFLNIGPLANKQQYDNFSSHINDAKNKGAKFLVGGKPVSGKGYYFEPTILVNVKDNMKIMTEETFGPALPIQIVKNVDEGIRKANNTPFGLTASIWTTNKSKFKEYIFKLEAGSVCINDTGGAGSGTPWGGIKESGMGRLNSVEGLLQFTQTKSVGIND